MDELKVGDIVRVQHVTEKWNLIGEITRIQPCFRSCLVKSETSRLYWRNRRYLRLFVDEEHSDLKRHNTERDKKAPAEDGMTRRRGARERRQTEFFRP